ncbi:glycosyltransferase family 2 protein [Enterococcus raffinosus]|uniref:glycosyltransferase family 2 protein n=1 Tax=Enterococcus raffinosus TaxID=71452 RepID=UPI001C95C975|nr:glycosyltransferase family 2 protein [Enterococcus raffinosus]QZO08497.1 glycosyltransferase family 2 protein [Enterococcus raffinosus]
MNLKTLLPSWFVTLVYNFEILKDRKKIEIKYRNVNEIIDTLIKENVGLNIQDPESARISLQNLLKNRPREFEDGMNGYFGNQIIPIQQPVNDIGEISLIVGTYNDINKIGEFLNYYRNLGIEHFVVMDNCSDDGTLNFLMKQKDVDIYQINTKYNSQKRAGWRNRLIAYYGLERYYLCLDSDEFLFFEDSENSDIKSLINIMKTKGQKHIRSFLLDMYADKFFYNSTGEDFINQCVYYDWSTYSESKYGVGIHLRGGVRERIFGISNENTKYPLFKATKGDFFTDHYPIFYQQKYSQSLDCGLKHYKFLPTDIKKYQEFVKSGIYSNGSSEYKRYLEVIEDGIPNFVSKYHSKKFDCASNVLNVLRSSIKRG